MHSGSVAVFIIDLDRSFETEEAVRAVLKSTSVDHTVLLHINGSGAEHAARLTQAFRNNPRVLISGTGKNVGFTGAVNILMRKMRENLHPVQFILLLNNDACVEPDTIFRLVTVLDSHPDAGAVGPRILQGMNTELIAADGARTWFWVMQQSFRNAGTRRTDCPIYPAFAVPFVSGACMLVRADLFMQLGGFDECFFAYFEDWDLCLRMRAMGYNCLHVSDATVRHVGSMTSGTDSLIYHFLMTRNRYLMARKHLPLPVFVFLFLPYFMLSRIAYKIILLLAKNRLQGVKGILLALAWIMAPVSGRSRFWPVPNSCMPAGSNVVQP